MDFNTLDLSPTEQKNYRLLILEKEMRKNQQSLKKYENYLRINQESHILKLLEETIKQLREEGKEIQKDIEEEFKEKVSFT